MVSFTVSITGGTQYLARLAVGQGVTARVRGAIRRMGYELERKVKLEKLNGQVLNRRTGLLARSINTRFVSMPDSETAIVGTNLVYGRAWELGAKIPAFDIVPKFKKALHWPGAKHPVKVVHMPARKMLARPFLRPSLAEMRPRIHEELALAMRGIGTEG